MLPIRYLNKEASFIFILIFYKRDLTIKYHHTVLKLTVFSTLIYNTIFILRPKVYV